MQKLNKLMICPQGVPRCPKGVQKVPKGGGYACPYSGEPGMAWFWFGGRGGGPGGLLIKGQGYRFSGERGGSFLPLQGLGRFPHASERPKKLKKSLKALKTLF